MKYRIMYKVNYRIIYKVSHYLVELSHHLNHYLFKYIIELFMHICQYLQALMIIIGLSYFFPCAYLRGSWIVISMVPLVRSFLLFSVINISSYLCIVTLVKLNMHAVASSVRNFGDCRSRWSLEVLQLFELRIDFLFSCIIYDIVWPDEAPQLILSYHRFYHFIEMFRICCLRKGETAETLSREVMYRRYFMFYLTFHVIYFIICIVEFFVFRDETFALLYFLALFTVFLDCMNIGIILLSNSTPRKCLIFCCISSIITFIIYTGFVNNLCLLLRVFFFCYQNNILYFGTIFFKAKSITKMICNEFALHSNISCIPRTQKQTHAKHKTKHKQTKQYREWKHTLTSILTVLI